MDALDVHNLVSSARVQLSSVETALVTGEKGPLLELLVSDAILKLDKALAAIVEIEKARVGIECSNS